MKNKIQALLLFVAVVAIATITSCTRTCDLGYEGDHCVDPVRTKYVGTFSGSQTCGSTTDTFTVAISEISNDITKIRIINIGNTNLNAIGTVLENGSITIAPQSFGNGGNINGNVTIAGGKVNLAYHIVYDPNSGIQDANCTWVQN